VHHNHQASHATSLILQKVDGVLKYNHGEVKKSKKPKKESSQSSIAKPRLLWTIHMKKAYLQAYLALGNNGIVIKIFLKCSILTSSVFLAPASPSQLKEYLALHGLPLTKNQVTSYTQVQQQFI
jgi:hypothetical protein